MWFKVDDGFHASRKLLAIPKRGRFAAAGLWAIAGSWCGDQLTDGHVPEYMLAEWGAPPAAPMALVDCGLWEVELGGYAFCNWHEYQPSKSDVDAERATSRERMRDLRARRKQHVGDTQALRSEDVGATQALRNGDASDTRAARNQGNPQDSGAKDDAFTRTVTNGSEYVSNPDPTRPDPVSKDTEREASQAPPKQRRGSRIPDDWMPADDLASTMAIECPHVDQPMEHRKFLDYWKAQPGTKGVKLDWPATYRNWIRRAAESAPKTGNRSTDRMMNGYQAMAGFNANPTPDPWAGRELTQ